MFETGKFYTWRDIRAEIGGDGKQWYLPTVNGRVVAGCFKCSPTTNPDAPDIILPGNGPFIKEAARRFTAQGSAVPIFIKQAVNQWEYVGMYKVARQSFNKAEINQHAAKANRVNDVSSVLFLKSKQSGLNLAGCIGAMINKLRLAKASNDSLPSPKAKLKQTTLFEPGKLYTRNQIHAAVGGSMQSYLPTINGRVVAGCFKRSPDTNPDAPDIVLPGNGPLIQQAARQFTAQGNAVPVFMKQAVNQWQYVGMYKVARQSFDKSEINRHAARAKRINDVSSVLCLKKL